MKKNYLGLLIAVTCVAGLAGCNKEEGFSSDVLADAQHSWHVAGNNEVLVDGQWAGNAWDCTDDNKMVATSLADVASIDEALATTLSGKDLKALYKTEVRLGVADAGWTAKAMINGKVHEQNGSYAIKAIQGSYDEEDEVYIQDLWLPDPHKAHAESLTPNTLFIPKWVEAKDENGFSWSDNPVCIGDGGVYTLVTAQYNNVSSADAAGFGFALVLKEKAENGLPHTEYVPPVVSSYGVIGSFADNNWASDVADLALKDGKYVVDVEIAEGVEFKVRKDDAWDVAFGSTAVANADELEGLFDLSADNIKCLTAGTYTLSLDEASLQLTITAKSADTYGIIGSFEDNNWASDVADLVENSDGTFSVEVAIAEGVEFKLRVNDAWDVSYGSDAVANAADLAGSFEFGEGGANIKCIKAGTYVITFNPETNQLTITEKAA